MSVTIVTGPARVAGNLFAFALDVFFALFRRPFQLKEFLTQAWFIVTVTIIPTALVAIPFGAVIALQVGGLIQQFGAQSFTCSAAVLAVVRNAGPIATALLIAGAAGSAIARLLLPILLHLHYYLPSLRRFLLLLPLLLAHRLPHLQPLHSR